MSLKDHFQFVAQSLRRFETTGALVPSSPFLAKAMAWPLAHKHGASWKILEVGPGTGAFTRNLLRSIGEKDHLDCYELNLDFCQHLEESINKDRALKCRHGQFSLYHRDIRSLPKEARYHLVLCSLPFNNFPAQTVREIMGILYDCLKPGATLVYFEYLLIRKAKSATSNRKERQRLQEVEKIFKHYEALGRSHHEVVWMNLPPALVRSITKA